jgi:hypothetical protein
MEKRGLGPAGVLLTLLAALLLPATAPSRSSGSGTAERDELKAAFLFNFARYVEWPPNELSDDDSRIRICILDDSAFAAIAAETIGDRQANGRDVLVETRSSPERAAGCHILYAGEDWADRHVSILTATRGQSIFTLSDSPGFAKLGGVANFVQVGRKIRFEINHGAAQAANLKLSSQLLRIATLVE